MRRLVASCWILLLVILWLPGCASTDLASSSSTAPGYTRSADHYLGLPDADALAAYLRADSDAGPLVSAHRGGPMPAYPENALETFEHTLRYTPALIECDVRMTRDSVLVLMHDDTLDRTTTGRGAVAAHRFADLRTLLLVDNLGIRTPFRIPTLDETLAWAEGRA
ncbi:MAG: glycerophosphodiester phosphodiesterase family protein, partial [Rhodothermales bacterium]